MGSTSDGHAARYASSQAAAVQKAAWNDRGLESGLPGAYFAHPTQCQQPL